MRAVNDVIERATQARRGAQPIRLVLELKISVDGQIHKQHAEALARLREGV